jgi:PAS domain-containing protein
VSIDQNTGIFAILILLAIIGLLVTHVFQRPKPKPVNPILHHPPKGPVFLFDEGRLIDCTPAARALLASGMTIDDDWLRLMTLLKRQFPDAEAKLRDIATIGSFSDISYGDNGVATLLEAEFTAGLTKVTLSDPDMTVDANMAMAIAHRALSQEVAALREVVASAPILSWREDAEGKITWANTPYLILASETLAHGQELSWPLPRLFDRNASLQSADRQRQSVSVNTKTTAWFDLHSQISGHEWLCFATPADSAVTAEANLRDFMQTLSKTFAQLPIGLAIFDKDRKLQIFNPALLDLTALPADFLSNRPSLLSVLDALRERNLLPEPKNYQHWRRQIVEIEQATAAGIFQENWALSDGQTFRVTGRPHPNGALALMIEDISTEMQRTRRYRSDLELGHSVMDQMEQAIVVFSQSGHVMWSNTAYNALWGHDPNATVAEATVHAMCDHWKGKSAPTNLWLEIEEFVHTIGNRETWDGALRLTDGRLVSCRVAPVTAGATMVAFQTALKPAMPNIAPPQKSHKRAL